MIEFNDDWPSEIDLATYVALGDEGGARHEFLHHGRVLVAAFKRHAMQMPHMTTWSIEVVEISSGFFGLRGFSHTKNTVCDAELAGIIRDRVREIVESLSKRADALQMADWRTSTATI